MTRKERRKRFFREMVAEMIQDRGFRRLLRETVLMVVVESRRYNRIEEARGFLEACRDRSVDVRLDQDGRLTFSAPEALSAELRAMLLVCRESIVTYLRSLDDMERYSRASEVMSEQAKATGPHARDAIPDVNRGAGTNGPANRTSRPAS